MRQMKLVFSLCSLIMAVSGLCGCGARYINAKVATVPATTTLVGSPTGILHNPDNLPTPAKLEAEHLRDVSQEFFADREKDLDIHGDLNGAFTLDLLAVSQNATEDAFPLPTEFGIHTTSPHSKGELTQNGFAEIRFGYNGPVYTTERRDGGLFELTVSDIFQENGDWIASGLFCMIAKNKDDNSDNTRLFVMDGSFVARIKNH